MFKKLTHEELVQAIWDIRDIPEFLEEMRISELKQIANLLRDWHYEIFMLIDAKFIESGSKIDVWFSLKKENLLNGFSMDDVTTIQDKIKNIIDPEGREEFDRMLRKLSNDFNYRYVTTKFTIIYHFLNSMMKTMPFSKEDYLKHITTHFDLGNIQFKRLAFDDYTDRRLSDNIETLMKIIDF